MDVEDVFDTEHDTATNGYPPGTVEKALQGGAPQRVGRFEYRYNTDAWTWSDTVARIHGYEPGAVEPTTELVLSHKHPDDLAQVKGLLQQSAAPFSSRHRIQTTTGEIRKVVVVGHAVTDAAGKIVATRGFYVDLTEAIEADVQQEIGEELEAIVAHREIIEQAKGMLMATYALNADSAFQVLRWRSQELNVKLYRVAEMLVAGLPSRLQIDSACRGPADQFLMTLDMHDSEG